MIIIFNLLLAVDCHLDDKRRYICVCESKRKGEEGLFVCLLFEEEKEEKKVGKPTTK